MENVIIALGVMWDRLIRVVTDSDVTSALGIMWKGMFGIFIFMALFLGIVTALDRIFIKNKANK